MPTKMSSMTSGRWIIATLFLWIFLFKWNQMNDLCFSLQPIDIDSNKYIAEHLSKEKKSAKDDYAFYSFDQEEVSDSKDRKSFHGVQARAFPARQSPMPCFLPWHNTPKGSTLDRGHLFVKPYKTGSTTGSSVVIRILRNAAKRQRTSYLPRNHTHSSSNARWSVKPSEFWNYCLGYWDHRPASNLYPKRQTDESFLWSVLRDPTHRLVSHYFFGFTSQMREQPLDTNFIRHLSEPGGKGGNHYNQYHYLHMLSLQNTHEIPAPPAANATSIPKSSPATMRRLVQDIIDQYDFLAVTERMEESMVTLAMLLKIPLADVLYLNSRGRGQFAYVPPVCFYVTPPFVSEGMRAHFRTPQFQAIVEWDHVLHRVANLSLDLTIDALGRDVFEGHLQTFRRAEAALQERCSKAPHYTPPCGSDGTESARENTTCILPDGACAMDCLDQIATEMQLWEPVGV